MQLSNDGENCVELLRWWHQYQAQQMMQATDAIRNGLLQEMLGLRRRLELTYQAREDRADCALNLADLKRLYEDLETLCDRLDSPFGQDSLPLALQHLLHPWGKQGWLTLTLPTEWTPEPVEHSRLLIVLTEHIVQAIAPQEPRRNAPGAIAQVHLQEQAGQKCLEITLTSEAAIALMASPSAENLAGWVPNEMPPPLDTLIPFLQTFCLFTQGQYALEGGAQSWKLALHWQRSAQPMADSENAHRIKQRINP